MSALAFSFSHPQAIYVAFKKKCQKALKKLVFPVTFKLSPVLMARNSAVSIRVRFFWNRRYVWGKEICELQKKKKWSVYIPLWKSLTFREQDENLCHHTDSQQWAESAELVAQQQLTIAHGGQSLTPCWSLLFGSLPFLWRVCEAMEVCLPQRETLHTQGILVTWWCCGFKYLRYA